MTDPQTDFAVKFALNAFTEVFKGAYHGALNWAQAKNQEHDFFNKKAQLYGEKMKTRYNKIKILGMTEPRPLRSIFVRTNILEKITDRTRIDLATLENQIDFANRRFGKPKESKSGLEVAQQLEKYIVLGKPGAGKTTYLKRIVLHSLEGDFTYQRLPIFISLKEYSDSGKSLFDFIVNEFDICSLPDAEPFVTNLLKIGKAQILLDALDEVQVEHEDRVIQEIKDLSDKYDKCQYIMTCRIAAFNAHFEQFTDVEIDDFNDGQIQEFIHNWFQVEPELAKECWEKLESMQTVKELASTPILLTLLCILYEDSLDFPQSRAEIYMEAIDTMLKKWDSSRRIKRKGESTYETLSFTKRKTLLARIAFQTFSQGEFFIPQRRLEKLIKDYIQNLPHIKESSLEVESREVLTSMIAQHGLIVPRAKGIYSFSHLSIQELFTAHFLVSSPQSEQLIKDAIENYVSNPQWREVFLLIAGMLEEADGFIMNLREYIDIYAHEYGLIDFLSEANNLLKNSSIIKGKSRERIIAGLQNVLTESINRSYELLRINARTLSLDINYNRSHYLNLTLSFIIALEENQFDALDQKIDLVVRRALTLVDNYILEQDHAFKNDISFILEIPTYLQLNLLLLDCLLNSGAYISNQTRQNVLDELLLPPPTNIPIT